MAEHNKKYEASDLSIAKYSAVAGINPKSLQAYRYHAKKRNELQSGGVQVKPKFQEYDVGFTLKISIDENGLVNLYGIDPDSIANIIRACHAVPE